MAQISGCSKTVTQLNTITGCTEFDSSFLLLVVDTIHGETMNIQADTLFGCMVTGNTACCPIEYTPKQDDTNYNVGQITYDEKYFYFKFKNHLWSRWKHVW